MGEVNYIFVPDPKGGGHNQCVIVRAAPLVLATAAELGHEPHVHEYLRTLSADEPITLEVDALFEEDVDLIREFGHVHGRAVVARRAER